MNTPLWVRRKVFDSYGERPNEQKADLPPHGVRFTCPCCGYPTLGGRAEYQICELCNWEDDGQDAANADEIWGGPNHGYSLTDAQLNFERYLIMYSPEEDRRIGGPDSEKVKGIKRTLIGAFDQMLNEPSAEDLTGLWREVERCEKALYKELKLSIRKCSSESER